MEGNQFYQALNRLMTDSEYRTTVERNPQQLLEDYHLTKDDLETIANVREKAVNEPDVEGYTFEEDLGDAMQSIILLCCY